MGAIGGAVSDEIGTIAKGIEKFGEKIVFQMFAHGISQSLISGVQGGDMLQSFVSGALSSIVSSAWAGGKLTGDRNWGGLGGNFAGSDVGTLVFGTAAGAGGAALTKGNIWQGAAIGLVVSGLNHVAHSGDDEIDPPKKGRKSPTLDEANKHYRDRKGATMTVDASTVDLNFLDPTTMVKGKTYPVQTLTASRDGRVYGGITVKYEGNNQVSILPDTYNFEQHGSFFSSIGRNTANAIGRWYAGSGTKYKINFSGVNTIYKIPPPVNTYHQTSHGFRF